MKHIPTAPASAALVFVPFAVGYFLSYLFRSVNAVIAPNLAAEMGLSSAQLGLLTSTYFLTFALSQVPLGVLLDHYGPRRVQACLFAVAAVGALIFGTGTNLATLVAGRALIGLGVSAALMAALKAVVLAFPKERLALLNGCLVMFGGIGAYVAAGPTDALVRWSDWRLVFLILAAATALAALTILLVVPDQHRAAPTTLAKSLIGLRTVFSDSFFWRIAPASACAIGTAWAIQGLWAARWLADVDGLSRGDIVFCLSAMAGALAVGALAIGIAGDRLKRAGVNASVPLVTAFTAFALLQMGIIQHLPIPRLFLWCGCAALGGATVLSYAALAENFPKELAGRANGALNLLHIGVAFVVQWGIGAVVDLWPAAADGKHPAIAYETAFGLALAAQVLAIAWLVAPVARTARAKTVPAADDLMSART